MKLIKVLLTLFSTSVLFSHAQQSPQDLPHHKEQAFFSLTELQAADKQATADLQYIAASDQTLLAYRAYLPMSPHAVLIFYHGAGAHSGLSYSHIGVTLRDKFNIAVYTPDLRGHGYSQGTRGDTPNEQQVWQDINTLISLAQQQFPNSPIFLGGHSAGAGLLLNYAEWATQQTAPLAIAGYTFIAPYFGYRSDTNYQEDQQAFQFAQVKVSKFIANSVSGGLLFGHSKAVTFNYPNTVLTDNPKIVPFNTVNMSKAITPSQPNKQLVHASPFGLWIGSQDEAFDPIKVTEFAKLYAKQSQQNTIEIMQQANHFSIILEAAEQIGPWIYKIIKTH
ncbi:alpha/beta hydrolase [Psychromonas sp. KJ10-2]|uniref:alpha/beta hydrolase n=1 Tax=Psychromonas sp. KJ10-2 TaxID=3391822 RepID=UPI0039B51B8F